MEFIRFILFIISIEILLGAFYYAITPKSIKPREIIDYKSLLKGTIERIFLMVALINGFSQALTLFGALKLATRLKRENDVDKIKESTYNDFYLIGNFISVMTAILYTFLYSKLL